MTTMTTTNTAFEMPDYDDHHNPLSITEPQELQEEDGPRWWSSDQDAISHDGQVVGLCCSHSKSGEVPDVSLKSFRNYYNSGNYYTIVVLLLMSLLVVPIDQSSLLSLNATRLSSLSLSSLPLWTTPPPSESSHFTASSSTSSSSSFLPNHLLHHLHLTSPESKSKSFNNNQNQKSGSNSQNNNIFTTTNTSTDSKKLSNNSDELDQLMLMTNLSINFNRTKRRSSTSKSYSNVNGANVNVNVPSGNRKRKRELFAYTSIMSSNDDRDDLNDDGDDSRYMVPGHGKKSQLIAGTGGGGGGRRLRRLSPSSLSSSSSSNSLSIYAKVNLKPSYSLSSFSGGSGGGGPSGPSNLNSGGPNSGGPSSNLNPNLNRMKIMLNPPGGFGPGMAVVTPDQKCNFEIYPGGCFDENGSICDSSGSGRCVCRQGYTIQIGGIYCLRPAAIGEACYTTEQCQRKVSNSGCFNYREEYREENPSAFFGPSQSQWPMGECRCRVGHRYNEPERACVRSLVGSWCSNVWDCELADSDQNQQQHSSTSGHHDPSSHSHRSTSHVSAHPQSGQQASSIVAAARATPPQSKQRSANLVCENNLCNCSQHYHYNQTVEQCQFIETYGRKCRNRPATATATNQITTKSKPKRNSKLHRKRLSTFVTNDNDNEDGGELMQMDDYVGRMLEVTDNDDDVDGNGIYCNMPTICSRLNRTCQCSDGYEHQPKMSPQCQLINKAFAGSHYSKLPGGGGDQFGYGGEGHSNVGNFVEYVLYVLVPALIIIMMFKPCFRRIGEWRNHIHHYQSDSDFFLAGVPPPLSGVVPGNPGGLLRPPGPMDSVMMNGNGTMLESKIPPTLQAPPPLAAPGSVQYSSGGDYGHMSPYAYIFEPSSAAAVAADPCGYGMYAPANGINGNACNGGGNSMQLLREKLQTIEEGHLEPGDPNPNPNGPITTGATVHCNGSAVDGGSLELHANGPCCPAMVDAPGDCDGQPITLTNNNNNESNAVVDDDDPGTAAADHDTTTNDNDDINKHNNGEADQDQCC